MPSNHTLGRLVETSFIEAKIAGEYAKEHAESELRDLLAVVAEQSGRSPGPEDLDRGAAFVRDYIELVPYMIKVALTAAANVGLNAEMARIVGMVGSYWQQDDDIIPDHLGIIGLLDDAYCSLSSLQAVSDHFQLQTGKFLFPDDLSGANKVMRRIIGEPYSSDLDRLVIHTVVEAQLLDTLKKFASKEKQLDFANQSTIWNHGPAGNMTPGNLAGLGLAEDFKPD